LDSFLRIKDYCIATSLHLLGSYTWLDAYAAHIAIRGELNSKPHGTSFSQHLPIELPPGGLKKLKDIGVGFDPLMCAQVTIPFNMEHITTFIGLFIHGWILLYKHIDTLIGVLIHGWTVLLDKHIITFIGILIHGWTLLDKHITTFMRVLIHGWTLLDKHSLH
jgi:hypothetical protein